MKEVTVDEFLEKMDDIMDEYEKGGDEHYLIAYEKDGEVRKVVCTPYDGPYTETVKKDLDGELYVELPPRLLAKQGWGEGTELNMEVIDGAIHLTEVKK